MFGPMADDPIREHLVKSLGDLSLSRGETKAFKELLADGADSTRRRQIAKQAFLFAREVANAGEMEKAAQWIESIVDCLLFDPAPAAKGTNDASIETHFSPGEGCRNRIIELFRRSRESADVCVFTITDDRISDAILAAHARGTKIRIVSDNEKAYDIGSDLERFEATGIPVAVDTSPHHMHHKFAIFDSKIVVSGSYNWTRAAADVNEENVIVCDDLGLIRAFQGTFDRLWKQFSA